MQRSYVAMLLLPLLLSAAVPPTAAQPPVGDILSQAMSIVSGIVGSLGGESSAHSALLSLNQARPTATVKPCLAFLIPALC